MRRQHRPPPGRQAAAGQLDLFGLPQTLRKRCFSTLAVAKQADQAAVGTQFHGKSSSMRAAGQRLTRRLRTSAR